MPALSIKSLSCMRTEVAPEITGRLSAPQWFKVCLVTDFINISNGRPASENSSVWLLYDDEYIYFAFRFEESCMDKVRSECFMRDSEEIWSDDFFEIFLDVEHTHANYYNFIVNPRGTQFDALYTRMPTVPPKADAKWDSRWKVMTSTGGTYWQGEIAIPFRDIGGTPREGDTWGLNFHRLSTARKENDYWSPTNSPHNPRHFGDLIFGQRYCSLSSISLGKTRWGWNECELELTPFTATCPQVEIEMKIRSSRDIGVYLNRQKFNIDKNFGRLRIPYLIREAGEHQIQLAIFISATSKKIYSTTYYFDVPPLLELLPGTVLCHAESPSEPIKLRFNIDTASKLLGDLVLIVEVENNGQHFISKKFLDLPAIIANSPLTVLSPGELPNGKFKVHCSLHTKAGEELITFAGWLNKMASAQPFVIIPGCELTRLGARAHLLILNITEDIALPLDLQKTINEALASGGLPIIPHPNLLYGDEEALSAKDLSSLQNYLGIEVYNRIAAHQGAATCEKAWDTLLSAGRRLWAFAADDVHELEKDAGWAWIVVKCNKLTPNSILNAIKRGAFYASTGVILAEINVTGECLTVRADRQLKMDFIGNGGRSLKTTYANMAGIKWAEIRPELTYVRVEVTDTKNKRETKAWTQPIFVDKMRVVYNPYDSPGKWYKGSIHVHTNRTDGKSTPSGVIQWHLENGYHFLAITDHDYLLHYLLSQDRASPALKSEMNVTKISTTFLNYLRDKENLQEKEAKSDGPRLSRKGKIN